MGVRGALPDADGPEALQREHDLREVYIALRWIARTGNPWRYIPDDSRTPPQWSWTAVRSRPHHKRGARPGYDGYKRKKGSKTHVAVDTLGNLLALHVMPADEQDRAQVAAPAEAVQEATGAPVELAYVDQGYTGEAPA